jgi:hypothetical protein
MAATLAARSLQDRASEAAGDAIGCRRLLASAPGYDGSCSEAGDGCVGRSASGVGFNTAGLVNARLRCLAYSAPRSCYVIAVSPSLAALGGLASGWSIRRNGCTIRLMHRNDRVDPRTLGLSCLHPHDLGLLRHSKKSFRLPGGNRRCAGSPYAAIDAHRSTHQLELHVGKYEPLIQRQGDV